MSTIAALFVESAGCYFGLPDVEPWDVHRDARKYPGPHPVVAHPPCKRWGRFWHGSPRRPHQFKLGDDDGCFAAALAHVRRFGGVLEHPADSHAWAWHGLLKPRRTESWMRSDDHGGSSIYVEQGHFGHVARKPTWLYAAHCDLPELPRERLAQRLNPKVLEARGYAVARRMGMIGCLGNEKRGASGRSITPQPFRDLLLGIARTAQAA